MDNTELMHHGIKGMKWGVRRFQDKSGRLTTAGKKRYSEDGSGDKPQKQTRYDKLYAKYKTLGYSDEKARQTAKGRVKTERALAIIGGATVTAAAAYAAYKFHDAKVDRFIAPNKMLQTVHQGDVSGRIKPGNPFYASYTKADNTIYASKVFSHFTDQSNVTKMYTKDGIKVASEGTGRKIFEELCQSNPELKQYAACVGATGNAKKAYRRFNYSLVVRNDSPSAKQLGWDKLDHDKVHKTFYNELKKRGYGAVVDVNDSKVEGFTFNPVIVFDDQVKHVISTTKATTKDLGIGKTRKASAWVSARKTLNKPISSHPQAAMVGAGALYGLGTTTATVVKDNRTVSKKSAFVEQYLKEHPNSELTTAEIDRMYKKQLSKKK